MDEVIAANLEQFADGADVARYLATPYHARRVAAGVELLLATLGRRSDRPVVADLGAGSATAARLLRESGVQAVMVDLADLADRTAAADFANRTAAAASADGSSGSVPLVRADLTRPLPFRTGSLDGIFAGEVVEHLFDPVSFLTECRRVLAPGGSIVVTTPNLAALTDRIRFLAGHSPRQVDVLHPYLCLHIRPFTYRSLARTLGAGGFVPTGLRSNYLQLGRGRIAVSSRILARVFPSLGGSLIVAAVSGPPPPVVPPRR
ncbi:MAG: class I SAM-dependent methyltransferase [Frankia sp.]